MAVSKRDQLIDTAQQLFYREGYHATGIDRILAESGVAKMTLYKHFKSKDELIIAALQARQEQTLAWLKEGRARFEPREALLRIFDGLHAMIHREQFCGCLFINAAAEFHQHDHPIHRSSAEYKARFREHLQTLLDEIGAPQPESLARQLQFLIEGVLTMAHIEGPGDQAMDAKAAAERLLQAAGL